MVGAEIINIKKIVLKGVISLRLINNERKVDYNEILNIELSLKELIAIYGGVATSNTNNVNRWLTNYKDIKELAKEFDEKDYAYKVYEDISEILRNKGVNI